MASQSHCSKFLQTKLINGHWSGQMPPPVRFRAAPMSACLNFHLTASKFSTPFPKNLAGCIYLFCCKCVSDLRFYFQWFSSSFFCKKLRKLMPCDEIFMAQLRILCIKLTLLTLLINFPRTSTWYQQWAQNHIRILLLKRSRAVKNIIFNFFLCLG